MKHAKGGPDPILDVCWTSDSEFVTVGPKNYQVWTWNAGKGKLSKKKGRLTTAKIDSKLICCTYDPHI